MGKSKEAFPPTIPRAALTPEEHEVLMTDLASAFAVEYPQPDDPPGSPLLQPMEQMPIARAG